MKGAILKLAIAGAVVVALGAVLAVSAIRARTRGKMSHCRNNIRHIGGIAIRNWEDRDIHSESVKNLRGRRFWQFMRERQYKNVVTGRWQYPDPDPFVCPVFGKTVSNPDDPNAIDYRGPNEIRYDESQDKPVPPADGQVLAADRAGNHASGGHVVYRDLSVKDEPRLTVRLADEGDALWARAAAELSD